MSEPSTPFVLDAVIAGRLDDASEAINRDWGLGLVVQLRHENLGVHFSAVKWRARDGRAVVRLNPTLDDWGPFYAHLFAKRLLATLPLLAHHHHRGREDGEITLNLHDWGHTPGLAYCSNAAEHTLIPDPDFLASRGYREVRDNLARRAVPWSDRRPTALWRGTPGGDLRDGWRGLPRMRLCMLAKQPEVAELFDVGLNDIGGWWSAADRAEIEAADVARNWVPPEHFADYRTQIDIDGHTNAWGGFFQRLLSGSPVVKIESPGGFRQWYYDKLVPWENYVPVRSDMSDLIDKILWVRAHEAEAREIGRRGAALTGVMTYEAELDRAVDIIDAALGQAKANVSGAPNAGMATPPAA
jgi:hypothetical protein